jgi:transposase
LSLRYPDSYGFLSHRHVLEGGFTAIVTTPIRSVFNDEVWCVSELKQWRGIATRYEKRILNYRAAVVVAALMTWPAS